MTSLLLGLALSAPQTALAHPPRPVVVVLPAPVVFAPPVFVRPVYSPPVVVAPRRPVTVGEFARCFRPTPGTHHIWIIHPVTGQPVDVCFTLPAGCPEVRLRHREIEFDYGRREVEIQFRHNGTVRVDY